MAVSCSARAVLTTGVIKPFTAVTPVAINVFNERYLVVRFNRSVRYVDFARILIKQGCGKDDCGCG